MNLAPREIEEIAEVKEIIAEAERGFCCYLKNYKTFAIGLFNAMR